MNLDLHPHRLNELRKFVDNLSPEEIDGVIRSYREFERIGSIADDPAKKLAYQFMEQNNIPKGFGILWITNLAYACYEKYWLNQNN